MNRNKNGTTIMDGYRYIGGQIRMKWQRDGGKICTIAGTTGFILTGIHSSRTTYKIHDELAENGEKIRKAKEKREDDGKFTRVVRVVKEAGKCALKTSRHYIPDLVGGALSGYASGKGWGYEHGKYKSAVTMAGVIAADFANYRMNVIAEQGKDADRRYLTTKKNKEAIVEAELNDGTKLIPENNGEGGAFTVNLKPSMLRIWYSKETTPGVWSPSLAIRQSNLEHITRELEHKLVYCGHYTLNDVRREFYGGAKSDILGIGDMFGRVWRPGVKEHPEWGRLVDLHYKDDVDFWNGLTDSCWILIDIDNMPLSEIAYEQWDKDPMSCIPGVETL